MSKKVLVNKRIKYLLSTTNMSAERRLQQFLQMMVLFPASALKELLDVACLNIQGKWHKDSYRGVKAPHPGTPKLLVLMTTQSSLNESCPIRRSGLWMQPIVTFCICSWFRCLLYMAFPQLQKTAGLVRGSPSTWCIWRNIYIICHADLVLLPTN